MNEPNQPKSIEARARTVRELLDKAKYTIDFYQREYAWQERQVRELVDDLTGKFLDYHEPGHCRPQVEHYGHYFLGSVVLSHKRGQRFIVDGQQRLTTLTLLLIELHHRQGDRPDAVDVRNLIFSEKYGDKSFNLNVHDREPIMRALMDGTGALFDISEATPSVANIQARAANVVEHLPAEIDEVALPFFVDWLLENVHLVVIEAYSDEDAYTIFETMNDRGLSLSLPEMLKGYVLANVYLESDQREVNELWKARMQALRSEEDEGDADFFKDWLRARHAQTIRPGAKGAENKDYERIGTEFHRWVRDQRDLLGLVDTEGFLRFVRRDLDFFTRQILTIRKAMTNLEPGLEAIRFNADRGFTLQTQLMLAPLTPEDSKEATRRKMALVADFIDIWLARRIWCFRTISYSSVKYTIFQLTKELRGRDVNDLATFLREQLDAQPESFASAPQFRLHNQNYRQVRHILARLTLWLETQCGQPAHFEDLISQGKAKPFEIEHVWADRYERFTEWFNHQSDFDTERNRIGGLLLLQRGINQSLGDGTYEQKRDAYMAHSANLLARSLHPLAYQNHPTFLSLIEQTGLPFRSYDTFGPEEQQQRQELYIRIAEWVWNPSRLDLDGEKPPIYEPIATVDEEEAEAANRPDRYKARLAFWTKLLERAKARSDLHANISPGKYHWAGARRDGVWWNYWVTMAETRVTIYIDGPDAEANKTLFDALHDDHRDAIESAFGGPLDWQRLNDRRASWIGIKLEGGWVDDSTWDGAIDKAVDAMTRLYAAASPWLKKPGE